MTYTPHLLLIPVMAFILTFWSIKLFFWICGYDFKLMDLVRTMIDDIKRTFRR